MGFKGGKQAQMMPVFSSTADQVAAPTLSHVISVDLATIYIEWSLRTETMHALCMSSQLLNEDQITVVLLTILPEQRP